MLAGLVVTVEIIACSKPHVDLFALGIFAFERLEVPPFVLTKTGLVITDTGAER